MDRSSIQRHRNRLVGKSAFAVLLVVAAVGFSFNDSLVNLLVPEPDYYRVLMKELARQHYEGTGTTTIVKENDQAREFFEQQINLKNSHFHLPPASIQVSSNEMLDFWYIHEDDFLSRLPLEGNSGLKLNPSRVLNPPGQPVALWVYSKSENLLVTVFYETVSEDLLEIPQNRILQTLDLSGVVTVEGRLSNLKVMPFSAFLLPLGGMKLENLSRGSGKNPDLHRLDFLPLFYSANRTATVVRPQPNDPESIAELRREAAFQFVLTRAVLRYLIPGLGLLWLMKSLWGLRKLHPEYCSYLAKHLPAGEAARIGVVTFLFSDLDSRIKEARVRQHQLSIAEREETERRELKDLLREYRNELELHPDEAKQFDEALSADSLDELRKLRDRYHSTIEQRRQQLEIEQQQLRERQREIQRLESELELIPAEKRDNEAREAWELYNQAKSNDDLKTKLSLLKEARKRLPKELRPDRF
ncbi:MAG TPA: hypothetical protein VFC63_25320 [Blastocatellia bacterium]|nr:hypothetical protein [Blastocatellia bacterium]